MTLPLPSHYDDGSGNYLEPLHVDWTGMYWGEVVDVIYPDDPRSRTKLFPEYVVDINVIRDGLPSTARIDHCLIASTFGGLADRFVWTPRTQNVPGQTGATYVGSQVLVSFIDGQRHSAVIVSGLRAMTRHRLVDESDKGKAAKAKGHHLDFEFNGVQIGINKDGQLKAYYRGPTDRTGKSSLTDSDSRCYLTMDKDGILLGTTNGTIVNLDSRSGKDGIRISDPTGNTLSMTSDGITVMDKAGSTITLDGSGTVQVTGSSVVINGEGVDIVSGSTTIGKGADSAVVRGDDLKQELTALLTALQTFATGQFGGAPGPAANAAVLVQAIIKFQVAMSVPGKIFSAGAKVK